MKNRGNTSKAEFRAIIAVAILLIIGFILPDIVSRFAPAKDQAQVIIVHTGQPGNEKSNYNDNYKSNYKGKGQNQNQSRKHYPSQRQKTGSGFSDNEKYIDSGRSEIRCVAFDPNTVTKEELSEMGVDFYIAGNLVKYREHGGKFRSPEDLLRIYGIDSLIFNQLADCIEMQERPESSYEGSQLVEVNSATVEDWESLPGIGQTFAARIVKFRKSLGGFHSIDQVGELYGLPEETWEVIRPRLALVKSYDKIDINTISDEDLSLHPYVSRRQAAAIVNYRSHHGDFKGIGDLRKVYMLGESWIDKMLPYLDLDDPTIEQVDKSTIAAGND